jgi:hypothetical protein
LGEDAVFRVLMSDGRLLEGGPRAVQISDGKARSQIVGMVREEAVGKLVPPNIIVFEDAFAGISADVVYVWAHDQFAQDIVLREAPILPGDWDSSSAQIEILTEFRTDATVNVRKIKVGDESNELIDDDAVIDFGPMALIVGRAFPEAGSAFWVGDAVAPDGAPMVRKRWTESIDGWHLLTELVPWATVARELGHVHASTAPANRNRSETLQGNCLSDLAQSPVEHQSAMGYLLRLYSILGFSHL